MTGPSLVRRVGLTMVLALVSSGATAQDFVLQVGPPVAGNSQPSKRSVFVVRPGGCADPGRARITATAEGLVNGSRRSVPMQLWTLPTPGVHALPNEMPGAGLWVISLVGTCAGKTAGTIVSLGATPTYHREAVKQLSHAATPADIDAALEALTAGGQK